jgi:hypothetical protein
MLNAPLDNCVHNDGNDDCEALNELPGKFGSTQQHKAIVKRCKRHGADGSADDRA